MSPSTSFVPTHLLQNFLTPNFISRKLLLNHNIPPNTPLLSPPPSPTSSDQSYTSADNNSFDANVVMVLSVLLCALICSLGLNSIVRCALRCSNLLVTSESLTDTSSSQFPTTTTGVKKKALKTFTTVQYSTNDHLKNPGLDTECVICLSEFMNCDRVRILPKCNHGFHVKCIDEWLRSHSSCPKCRQCLGETCQKIVRCSESGDGGSGSSSEAVQVDLESHAVSIGDLEPEGFVRSYR